MKKALAIIASLLMLSPLTVSAEDERRDEYAKSVNQRTGRMGI